MHRLDVDRLAETLADVTGIHARAVARAAAPARIHEADWRGPAFAIYEAELAGFEADLAIARDDLAAARSALLRAVADAEAS